MPTVNNRSNIDRTVLIFDSFYAQNATVDAAKYDLVYSFFYAKNENKRIAANFAAALFRISQETGIDVVDLLNELKGTPNKLELNKTISYYLNLLKSKTSQYGVARVPVPNFPVARNVILWYG